MDIYDAEYVDDSIDDDMISEEEEGFMKGYLEAI